jgi:hypothetical protein
MPGTQDQQGETVKSAVSDPNIKMKQNQKEIQDEDPFDLQNICHAFPDGRFFGAHWLRSGGTDHHRNCGKDRLGALSEDQ